MLKIIGLVSFLSLVSSTVAFAIPWRPYPPMAPYCDKQGPVTQDGFGPCSYLGDLKAVPEKDESPLVGAPIIILNSDGKTLAIVKTNEKGEFSWSGVVDEGVYTIKLQKNISLNIVVLESEIIKGALFQKDTRVQKGLGFRTNHVLSDINNLIR